MKNRAALFKTPFAVACVVFGAAFLIRLVFAFQWHETPYGAAPQLDAAGYHQWAQEVASGHLLRERAFYQSPLYPYLLGTLYFLTGPSLWAATVLNILLDSLTCAVLALLSLSLFGPMAGWLAGFLAAFNAQLIFYTAMPMKEPLGLLFLTLFLSFSVKALYKKKNAAFLASGVALGLAALVRGNVLFFAFVFPFFFLRRQEDFNRKKAVGLALFFLGIALPILPVTVHNAYVSRDFVLINYAGGFNFYLGHFGKTDGISYVFPDAIAFDPAPEEFNTTAEASRALGRLAKPSEVSSYWSQKGLEEIVRDPAHEMIIILKKLGAFWRSTETFDNYDVPFIRKQFSTLLSWPLTGYRILAVLAPLGAVAFWARRRRAVSFMLAGMAAYALTLFLFYVTDRYRQPLIVFLFPLAGAAPFGAWFLWVRERRAALAFGFFLSLVSLGLSLWPRGAEPDNSAYNWSVIGTIEAERGRYAEAWTAIEKALSFGPVEAGRGTFKTGATILSEMDRLDQAEALVQEGLRVFPDDPTLLYEGGRLRALRGDLDSACLAMEKTIQASPNYTLPYYSLAFILMKRGRADEARAVAQKGLAIDPADPRLLVLKRDLGME